MMAAMVQSFPSSTSTLTMMQPRPSPSEPYQNGSQAQQPQRAHHIPRNIYNTSVGGMAAGSYRGQVSTASMGPYTFQNTTILPNTGNPLRQHPTAPSIPRLESRTASAPSVPLSLQAVQQTNSTSSRPRPPQVTPISAFNPQQQILRNDASLSSTTTTHQNSNSNSRPLSSLDLNPPTLQPASYATVAKSSPDRYKRNHRRAETSGALSLNTSAQGGSAMPSGSGMAAVGNLYTHPVQSSSTPSLTTYRSQSPSSPVVNEFGHDPPVKFASRDDSNLQRDRQGSSDLAKRYRRRSISSMEVKDYTLSENTVPTQQAAQPKTYAAMLAGPAPTPQAPAQERRDYRNNVTPERPNSAHGRNGSNESSTSGKSSTKASSVRPAARLDNAVFSSAPKYHQNKYPVPHHMFHKS